MNPIFLLHRPKRLLVLSLLASVGVILAACSPGTIVLIGKDTKTGDTLRVVMACRAIATSPGSSCKGIITGKVSGHPFLTTSGSQGFGDISIGVIPEDCASAPCSADAGADIVGSGTYLGQSVPYELQAWDNDPPNPYLDTAKFYVNGNEETDITCSGCIEIKMQPGSFPLEPPSS